MRRDLAVCLLLVAATLAPYGQVIHHDFVNVDDDRYVYDNPHVREGLAWGNVGWAFTSVREGNWHPLTWLSHMVDSELFGLNAGYHHLVNVLCHVLSTVLLYLVFRRMTGALWRSAMVAGLFALHPLHVESVAWISERKDLLSTVFFMLTLGAYARYTSGPTPMRYGMVILFLALGLMAKPMLVTAPFVLLLLDYWPLRRWPAKRIAMRLILEKVPLFILAAASSVVTFLAQRQQGAMSLSFVVPWSARIANALVTYVGYAAKMLWPFRLAVFYPYRKSVATVEWLGAGLLLAGVSVLAVWAGRRWRYLAVGWFWYLGTLVPVIGLVQVGGQSMADRYTYIPLIGLFIPLVWGVADLLAGRKYGREALVGSSVVVILLCMSLTWLQVRHWRDGETLFAHALEVTRDNAFAHNNYANALRAKGKVEEAIEHYRETLRIVPGHAESHDHLGLLLAEKGASEKAMAHFRKALKINPGYTEAHNNLGVLLDRQGDPAAAMTHFQEAIRLDPGNADAHHNLGVVLARQNRQEEAIGHYREALRVRPDYGHAHQKLGLLLAEQGNREEAIAHLREALGLDPESAELHTKLALALAGQGDREGAAHHYQEAIRLDPEDPAPYNNLAWIRATDPDPAFRGGAEAVDLAERACKLTARKNPVLLDTLAAAYAEAGRFPEAVAALREAVELATSGGGSGLIPILEERLRLYEVGRPYREEGRGNQP